MELRLVSTFIMLGLAFIQAAEAVDGVINLRVTKVAHSGPKAKQARGVENDLFRRAAEEVSDQLDNKHYYYSTTVQIGTPPQPVELLLDTGSSDTWVFTKTTQATGNQEPTSFFDPGSSSTFHTNNTQFQIRYGIGASSGTWGTDVFQIGNAKVRGLSIGIASQAAVSQGIIGIGRPEAECTTKNGRTYENLPLKLAAQGVINSAAYSLFLDDMSSQTGNILFGGVDTARFTGSLRQFPVTHPKHLGIDLKGLRTDGRITKNLISETKSAVLDSGTTLSYFPGDVIGELHTALNANPSFTIGQKYYCDCNVTNSLAMDFGGKTIEVPANYFLWPIENIVNPIVAQLAFPPNSCYIGLEETGRDMDFNLIGDNLLRAFYTVYDISNEKIAIGQANYQHGGASNIQAITRGVIPGVAA